MEARDVCLRQVGWLARALVAASDRLNAATGLDVAPDPGDPPPDLSLLV